MADMPKKILRLKQVQAATGLSRSSIYRLMKAGQFPQSVSLSPGAIGFHSHEIESWIESRQRAA